MNTLFVAALLMLVPPQEGLHVDRDSGEMTLRGNMAKMSVHADPSKWHVITDMVLYKGNLIASAAQDFETEWMFKPFAYSNGAQVLRYRPERDDWEILYDKKESIFMNIRVVGEKLMIPEFFPLNGRPRIIHTWDGKKWDQLGLLPRIGWHAMEVLGGGGKIYASGSWRSADPEDQKNDPNWWPGYGRCYESSDAGKTWKLLRQTKKNGRILDMVWFKGRLYANERGMQLISWDGKKWTEIPVELKTRQRIAPKLGNAHLAVFADKIIAINVPLYYLYDGKKWTSHTPGYIDLFIDGEQMYGLRDNGEVWVTRDAIKWTKVTSVSVPKKEFARTTDNGRRPLHRGSVAVHRGRLFVGTGSNGVIYASGYEKKGEHVSEPLQTEASEVTYDAVVPEGASLTFRIRTADSKAGLDKASWRKKLAIPGRHGWVQWKVEMKSGGKRTPVLRSVLLK